MVAKIFACNGILEIQELDHVRLKNKFIVLYYSSKIC